MFPSFSYSPIILRMVLLAGGLLPLVAHATVHSSVGNTPYFFTMMAQTQSDRTSSRLPSPGQSRFALVIGNAAYGPAIGPLRNSGNDATDMTAALRQLGFVVTLLRDVTHQQMEDAIDTFSRQLRPESVGLFYFSGHGVQVDGGNYLIPVGARLTQATDVKFQAVAAEWVLARMEGVGNALNLVILDACRNAPFLRQWRSLSRGLAPMQAARGSLIAYATSPGAVAEDGSGRNGTYTKHLLRFMTAPNLLVEQMFKQVRLAVEEETRGKQTPWESSSLRGDFAFASPALGHASPHASSDPQSSPHVAGGLAAPHVQASPATIVGNDGAEMVLVSAGTFLMGSEEDEIHRLLRGQSVFKRRDLEDEMPRRHVFLGDFYIDKYEVTNARFQQFVQATGYRTQAEREGWGGVFLDQKFDNVPGATWRTPEGPGSTLNGLERHPVRQMSWEDAQAYCTWAGKRLPTEAEWEKAARGTDGRAWPWGNHFEGTRLNFCDRRCHLERRDSTVEDGYHYTAPVGSYEGGKSPYGAYDLAGNVWEWVADWYDATYYWRAPTQNPPGPPSGDTWVLRGGSWNNVAMHTRAAKRGLRDIPRNYRSIGTGMRCAKSL